MGVLPSVERVPVRRALVALVLALGLHLGATAAGAATLRGSEASMRNQFQVSRNEGYATARTTKHLLEQVKTGGLVSIRGNSHYELASGVSFAYARPAVKSFIEDLGRDYHAATGEKLVITSLTRPVSLQPRNASRYSVHPSGMAVDLRRSSSAKSRRWLESRLLTLERKGVIDATHERRPPHYHVAVFPTRFETFLAQNRPVTMPPVEVVAAAPTASKAAEGLTASSEPTVQSTAKATKRTPRPARTRTLQASTRSSDYASYRVRRGDSLWDIAKKFGTSVSRIRQLNGMRNSQIFPGQTLMVPGHGAGRTVATAR